MNIFKFRFNPSGGYDYGATNFGGIYRVAMGGASATTSPADLSQYFYHFAISGQSLSLGVSGSPALTTASVYNTNFSVNSNNTVLVPLLEGAPHWSNLETQASSIGNQFRKMLGNQGLKIIVDRHGLAGAAYSALASGTVPYASGVADMNTAKTQANASGGIYQMRGLFIIHGETDEANQNYSYNANLTTWQNDWERDANSIEGSSRNVPMFLDQMNTWNKSNNHSTGTLIAQLQRSASLANPTLIYLVGPKYQYVYTGDHQHLSNSAYRLAGEKMGEVAYRVIRNGETWKPLSPNTITASGSTIDIVFNVPNPPIVLDIITLPSASNYGFDIWSARVQPIACFSASIINSNTVRMYCNQSLGPDTRVRYAFSGALSQGGGNGLLSPIGNIKDSDNEVYDSGGDAANWLIAFEEPISGTTIQPSEATHHISLSGATKNISFNNTSSLAFSSSATWTFWIRRDDVTDNRIMFEKGGVNEWSFRCQTVGNNWRPRFLMSGSGNSFRADLTFLTSSIWMNLSFIYHSGNMSWFHNGSRVRDTTSLGTIPSVCPSGSGNIVLGNNTFNTNADYCYVAFWPNVSASMQQIYDISQNPINFNTSSIGQPALWLRPSGTDTTGSNGFQNFGYVPISGSGGNLVAGDIVLGDVPNN